MKEPLDSISYLYIENIVKSFETKLQLYVKLEGNIAGY